MNGTKYAVMKDMDAMHILDNMEQYAKELSYVLFSKREIEAKGADLAERSEWVEMLYDIFHYQLQKSSLEAQEWLFQLVHSICSGYTLSKMVPLVEKEIQDRHGG